MAKKKIETGNPVSVQLPLPVKWHMPDNITSQFASHMIVLTVENEFKILFFEIKPPLIFSTSEPTPKEVQADCIASIIVTADRLPKFIEAMQKQLEIYNSIKKPGI